MNTKRLSPLATLLVLSALVAVSCGQAAPTTPAPAPTQAQVAAKAPAPAPTAAAAQAGAAGDQDRFTWDGNAKKWLPRDPAPKGTVTTDWKANPRKAAKKWLVGFSNVSRDLDIGVQAEKSVKQTADEAGVDLFATDNKTPDAQLPLTNAEAMVTRKVDIVLNWNTLAKLGPAIMEKYQAAKTPTISIDVLHPNSLFFGVDNYQAGVIGGQYMVDWAKKNNWPADKITIVTLVEPDVGEIPRLRTKGFEDALKKASPGAQIFNIPGGSEAEKALNAMSAWLTAHPNEHNVMVAGNNDRAATGALAAVQAGGRDKDVAIMGMSADANALAELARPENPFKGSVSFFPEKYGYYLIWMALDVLEGKPVPAEVHLTHSVVDRVNFKQLYPDYKPAK